MSGREGEWKSGRAARLWKQIPCFPGCLLARRGLCLGCLGRLGRLCYCVVGRRREVVVGRAQKQIWGKMLTRLRITFCQRWAVLAMAWPRPGRGAGDRLRAAYRDNACKCCSAGITRYVAVLGEHTSLSLLDCFSAKKPANTHQTREDLDFELTTTHRIWGSGALPGKKHIAWPAVEILSRRGGMVYPMYRYGYLYKFPGSQARVIPGCPMPPRLGGWPEKQQVFGVIVHTHPYLPDIHHPGDS